ncbi:hypothetical protein PMIN03_012466 [Paraphaeosphaeria minitans]
MVYSVPYLVSILSQLIDSIQFAICDGFNLNPAALRYATRGRTEIKNGKNSLWRSLHVKTVIRLHSCFRVHEAFNRFLLFRRNGGRGLLDQIGLIPDHIPHILGAAKVYACRRYSS